MQVDFSPHGSLPWQGLVDMTVLLTLIGDQNQVVVQLKANFKFEPYTALAACNLVYIQLRNAIMLAYELRLNCEVTKNL